MGSGRRFEGDRPAVELRMKGERSDPGTIEVRTHFLYSPFYSPGNSVDGRLTAYSRGGVVTSSDWPGTWDHERTVAANVGRAIASFGDDADLVITVALRAKPRGGTDD